MADVLFLAVLAGFFAVCVVFVKACERMVDRGDVGGRGEGAGDPEPLDATVEVAA